MSIPFVSSYHFDSESQNFASNSFSRHNNSLSLTKRSTEDDLPGEAPWLRAARLVEDLFANYSKLVRPRLDQSKTVNVRFDIRMKQLVEVDIKSQQVRSDDVTFSFSSQLLSTFSTFSKTLHSMLELVLSTFYLFKASRLRIKKALSLLIMLKAGFQKFWKISLQNFSEESLSSSKNAFLVLKCQKTENNPTMPKNVNLRPFMGFEKHLDFSSCKHRHPKDPYETFPKTLHSAKEKRKRKFFLNLIKI